MNDSCEEYSQMLLALDFYKPRDWVTYWTMRAYNDPEWDWTKSDGCTAVNEARFPKGHRFPPCVGHDYFCENWERLGLSRWFGDLYFLCAMFDFMVWKPRAIARFLGVRFYWLLWGKWRYHPNSSPMKSGRTRNFSR